jgi:hypothetical protein
MGQDKVHTLFACAASIDTGQAEIWLLHGAEFGFRHFGYIFSSDSWNRGILSAA